MSKQRIENNQDSQSSSNDKAQKTAQQVSPPKIQDREFRISIVAPVIADAFVKQGDKYFHVDSLSCPLSSGDADSIARQIIRKQFPHEDKEPDLVEAILKRAFSGTTKEPEQSIALWNKTTRCSPGNRGRVLRGQYMASINTWKQPEYRQLGIKEADMGMLDEFLDRTFVESSDRSRFLDWLSWTLQNEQKKPGFAPLLYSREKGTGKSTLCQFVSRLFGKDNTHSANGLSQVTGRFNKPMLDSKLLGAMPKSW